MGTGCCRDLVQDRVDPNSDDGKMKKVTQRKIIGAVITVDDNRSAITAKPAVMMQRTKKPAKLNLLLKPCESKPVSLCLDALGPTLVTNYLLRRYRALADCLELKVQKNSGHVDAICRFAYFSR